MIRTMTLKDQLEQYAHEREIEICDVRFREVRSMAMEYRGAYSIAMDSCQLTEEKEQNAALLHELGHIETGTLHPISSYDSPGKGEYKAWKWAILRALPEERLRRVIADCGGRLWEAAEELDVTEQMIKRAMEHYHVSLEDAEGL